LFTKGEWEKMTGDADREGEYEREGFGIEMVYMIHQNHCSGGLHFLVGKEYRKPHCFVE
jgi:hypothetical protein